MIISSVQVVGFANQEPVVSVETVNDVDFEKLSVGAITNTQVNTEYPNTVNSLTTKTNNSFEIGDMGTSTKALKAKFTSKITSNFPYFELKYSGEKNGGIVAFEFDVMPGAGTRMYAEPRMAKATGGDDGNMNPDQIAIFKNGGSFGTSSIYYTAGNIYKIKYIINFENNTYELLYKPLSGESSYTSVDKGNINIGTKNNKLHGMRFNIGCNSQNVSADNPIYIGIDNLKITRSATAPKAVGASYKSYSGITIAANVADIRIPASATEITTTLSGSIANTDNKIILLKADGTNAEADISVNGASITIVPKQELNIGVYNIVIGKDVTFDGGTAYGADYEIPFTVYSALEILAPTQGQIVTGGDKCNITASISNAATAEIYIDNVLKGTCTPDARGFITYSLDTQSLALGKKDLKVITYNSDDTYDVLSSSFILSDSIVEKYNYTFEGENPTYTNLLLNPKNSFTVTKEITNGNTGNGLSYTYDKKGGSWGSGSANVANIELLGIGGSSGKVVIEEDIYFPSKGMQFNFETSCKLKLPVSGEKIYKDAGLNEEITATSSNNTATIYPLGNCKFYNGNIQATGFTTKTLSENTWHKLKIVYDLDANKSEVWIDSVKFGEKALNIDSGRTKYYTKNTDGTAQEHTTTGADLQITWLRMSITVNKPSEIPTESTPTELIRLDNVRVSNVLDIPDISASGYIENSAEISVTSAASIIPCDAEALIAAFSMDCYPDSVTKDNVKLIVNGAETQYKDVSYSNKKVILTLNDDFTFEKNSDIKIVFGENIQLVNGTEVGKGNIISYKAGEDGLYLHTDLEKNDNSNSVYAWFDGVNENNENKEVVIILATYTADKMLNSIDFKTVTIDDSLSTVLKLSKENVDMTKVMVWDNLTSVTPLADSKEK